MADIGSTPGAVGEDLVLVGNLVLNAGNYRVSIGGEPVELTYHEFDLLRLLAAQADRVVDFKELTQALWKSQGHKDVRRLNVLAFRLRSKLVGSDPYHIETVRGRGYGLIKSIQAGGQNGATS